MTNHTIHIGEFIKVAGTLRQVKLVRWEGNIERVAYNDNGLKWTTATQIEAEAKQAAIDAEWSNWERTTIYRWR